MPAELMGGELRALGAAVRELRARRGLSQEALGFRGDLHRNYVGGIERELNITFRVLLKLTGGLSVPLSELVALYERNRAGCSGGQALDAEEHREHRPRAPRAVLRRAAGGRDRAPRT